MSNDECRKNVERMSKSDGEKRHEPPDRVSGFVIWISFVLSAFVISKLDAVLISDFAWQICPPAVSTECSLKTDGHVRPLSPQPDAWEPRENRGRLRHCYGLQTPTATGSALAEPGRRERGRRPEVRIPVRLCSSRSRWCGTNFSVQEKDEASS